MEKKIPITFGIIGHLDALITAEHKKIITSLFDTIHSLYPNSPVCLFSQLAPGADLEISNLFFDIKETTGRDYYLIAPIPFEIEEYKSVFNEGDKKNFDLLLSKAKRYFVLQHSSVIQNNINKNDLYRLGGQFVADSSIIFIAVWDLIENGKKGGTADIVNYKRQGLFKGEVQDRIYDQAVSFISLECNRASKPGKQIILSSESLYKVIENDAGITKCLEKIEQLNTALEKLDNSFLQNAANNLYGDAGKLSQSNSILRNYYSVADVLAIKNQKSYNATVKALFVLGFAFIVFFELYKHDSPFEIALKLALGVGLIAFIIYLLSRRWQNHIKFLENRITAEVLRIQFFWNLSNVRKSVTNYILRIYKSEFLWFKHFLLSINGITYQNEPGIINADILKKCWLTSELAYFEKKISSIINTKKILNNIATVSFVIAIALMMILVFLKEEPYLTIATVTVGIALGIFALSSAYIEIRGLRETINQYSLMKNVYKSSIDKLNELEKEDIEEATKNQHISRLFYLAGKEALVENGNWYLIFKNKEPKVKGIGG